MSGLILQLDKRLYNFYSFNENNTDVNTMLIKSVEEIEVDAGDHGNVTFLKRGGVACNLLIGATEDSGEQDAIATAVDLDIAKWRVIKLNTF